MTNVLLLLLLLVVVVLVVVVVVVVLVLLMLLLPLLLLLLLLLLLQCRASMLEMNLNKWDQDLDSTMSSSSNSSDSGKRTRLFALTGFLSHLNVKMIILPRQARDKHTGKHSKRESAFSYRWRRRWLRVIHHGCAKKKPDWSPCLPAHLLFLRTFLVAMVVPSLSWQLTVRFIIHDNSRRRKTPHIVCAGVIARKGAFWACRCGGFKAAGRSLTAVGANPANIYPAINGMAPTWNETQFRRVHVQVCIYIYIYIPVCIYSTIYRCKWRLRQPARQSGQ
jgi:hypothetical protein